MTKVKIITQDTFMSTRDVQVLSKKLEEKVNEWIGSNNIKVIKTETTITNPNTRDMIMICTITYEDYDPNDPIVMY